tara:strand:- start:20 stop:709 length:690 start_codon:yes stop_codon:yes gene_type:complete
MTTTPNNPNKAERKAERIAAMVGVIKSGDVYGDRLDDYAVEVKAHARRFGITTGHARCDLSDAFASILKAERKAKADEGRGYDAKVAALLLDRQAEEARAAVEFALTYPMLAERADTQFYADLNRGGPGMPRGVWNMIISKRDLSLWCGPSKMKPHRHWKVSDVKAYFGIKGSGAKLLAQFMALVAEVDALGDAIQADAEEVDPQEALNENARSLAAANARLAAEGGAQ